MKTSELTGAALDWAVAKCEGVDFTEVGVFHEINNFIGRRSVAGKANWSTDWSQGGPIIEREDISTIRLDDEDIPDAKGFWTGKTAPQWGAVMGDRHSPEEQHGSQGDYWGKSYHVDKDVVCGQTPLIAAMRCYVASKLGDNIDLPEELK